MAQPNNNRGGRRNEAAAANGTQVGRPRKSIEDKTARHDGKYAFWISGAHALKLQTLMLRAVPGVTTPDQMIEHLIDEA